MSDEESQRNPDTDTETQLKQAILDHIGGLDTKYGTPVALASAIIVAEVLWTGNDRQTLEVAYVCDPSDWNAIGMLDRALSGARIASDHSWTPTGDNEEGDE